MYILSPTRGKSLVGSDICLVGAYALILEVPTICSMAHPKNMSRSKMLYSARSPGAKTYHTVKAVENVLV